MTEDSWHRNPAGHFVAQKQNLLSDPQGQEGASLATISEAAHVVEGTANAKAWQFPLPREQRGEGGGQEEFHSFIS